MGNNGNCDMITREFFDSLLISTRQIDAVLANPQIELFGETLDTPVMTAAMSRLGSVYEDGAVEMARGVKDSGALMWAGVGEPDEIEAVGATGVRLVRIIKPHQDNGLIISEMEHAAGCGAIAVGVDIDHSFHNDGNYASWRDHPLCAKSREELKQLSRAAGLPFVIKGVLSVEDAVKSVEAEAAAIVLSHHHGKTDYSVPPLMLLPRIAKEVGKDITIIVDSGILDGYDAFKVLALGADAVGVGRGLLPSLKENGAAGVRDRIREITGELVGLMNKTCTPDVKSFDPDVIFSRQSGRNSGALWSM